MVGHPLSRHKISGNVRHVYRTVSHLGDGFNLIFPEPNVIQELFTNFNARAVRNLLLNVITGKWRINHKSKRLNSWAFLGKVRSADRKAHQPIGIPN